MEMVLGFPDYLLFFIGSINLILAIFIFINDVKNRVNISFAIYAFFLTVWSILLLLFRNVPLEYAGTIMRAIYVSGLCIAIGLWYFVHNFPKIYKMSIWQHLIIIVFGGAIFALLMTPGIIVEKAVVLGDGSRSVILNSFGYYLFAVPFTFFYCGALILFWINLRRFKKMVRNQYIILFVGLTIAVIFGGFFNIILPSPFFHNYNYIHLGPPFTFGVVVAVAYGIARYQLMNIKALVTEILVIVLILLQFIQVFSGDSGKDLIIGTGMLVAVVVIGFSLISSVLKEVKRREEVTKMAESLSRANLRLKELDRQKTEFLSIASHQLRTPLSIIKGYIELIHDGVYGRVTKKMQNILGNMDKNNERLIKLVDEFLDITRIEQNRTKFIFEKSDIREVIIDAVAELKENADKKKNRICLSLSKNMPKIIFDKDKIRNVIFNYLDNAIKYSKKSTITIKSKVEDDGIAVRVIDEGRGFNKVDQANFFQKFYRGENIKGESVNGNGLGIYVCKMFVDNHNGHVWAHSKGLGKGSEFGFWIPFGKKRIRK